MATMYEGYNYCVITGGVFKPWKAANLSSTVKFLQQEQCAHTVNTIPAVKTSQSQHIQLFIISLTVHCKPNNLEALHYPDMTTAFNQSQGGIHYLGTYTGLGL